MSLINAQTDFGVVLDGVTDNTTNLQAAANAAANGRLYIPAGVCVMGPVQFPANVEIFGDLIGSTILKRKDNTPGRLIKMSWTVGNSHIRDLTIDGNRQNNAGITHSDLSLSVNSATKPANTARRVEVKNSEYMAVDASGATYIDQCVLTGSGQAGVGAGYGIWAAHLSTNGRFTRNTITDFKLSAIFAGGIYSIENNDILGCHRDTVPYGGGQVADATNATIRGQIIGNRIGTGGGAATSGIEVNNAPVIILGNHVWDQANHGIYLQASAPHVVDLCVVKGCGVSGVSAAPGVTGYKIGSMNQIY